MATTVNQLLNLDGWFHSIILRIYRRARASSYVVLSQMEGLSGSEMAAVAGGQADAESLIALKDFMNRLGCERLCTEEKFPMDASGFVVYTGPDMTQCEPHTNVVFE